MISVSDAGIQTPLVCGFSVDQTKAMARRFRAAKPFPHIVIDDMLIDPDKRLIAGFPAPGWPHWNLFVDAYQKEKRHCNDLSLIPSPLSDLITECQQPRFLAFLETVTGIRQLTVDPYLYGGGLHCSGPGGVLRPHTDFHFHDDLSIYRRLNVLIYLNEDWQPADGGYLELYRKGATTPDVTVAPVYGKMVIFRTDDESVHGFANPVGPGKWRKSVALYYYTARDASGYSGDASTHWQMHGPRLTGARRSVFDGLMLASRGLSRLARIVNPDQG
jgi:Rps23 Pro-64 3,4-dihydroxylase Tpa1-like proline 4-hydroxylase